MRNSFPRLDARRQQKIRWTQKENCRRSTSVRFATPRFVRISTSTKAWCGECRASTQKQQQGDGGGEYHPKKDRDRGVSIVAHHSTMRPVGWSVLIWINLQRAVSRERPGAVRCMSAAHESHIRIRAAAVGSTTPRATASATWKWSSASMLAVCAVTSTQATRPSETFYNRPGRCRQIRAFSGLPCKTHPVECIEEKPKRSIRCNAAPQRCGGDEKGKQEWK